mmetsp:Transcript_1491/g.4034  ORF Transcript_1491/g.4034 Transcript_1491/m.4034 type:complete len:271 (+) Transcript_1491:278-1090(+)
MQSMRVGWGDHLVLRAREEEEGHLHRLYPLDGLPTEAEEAVLQRLEGDKREEDVHEGTDGCERVLQQQAARSALARLLHRPGQTDGDGAAEGSAEDKDLPAVEPALAGRGLQPTPSGERVLYEAVLGGRALALAVAAVVNGHDVASQPVDELLEVRNAKAHVAGVGMEEQHRGSPLPGLLGRGHEPAMNAQAVCGLQVDVLELQALICRRPEALGVLTRPLHAWHHTRHVEHGLLAHYQIDREEREHADDQRQGSRPRRVHVDKRQEHQQ